MISFVPFLNEVNLILFERQCFFVQVLFERIQLTWNAINKSFELVDYFFFCFQASCGSNSREKIEKFSLPEWDTAFNLVKCH